ncbi:polyprotein [Agapanthus velarivirus]|nr:polyprotein [Agapanthus velarivirus]
MKTKISKNNSTSSYITDARLPFNDDVSTALSPWRNSRMRRYGVFFTLFYCAPHGGVYSVLADLLTRTLSGKCLRLYADFFRVIYMGMFMNKLRLSLPIPFYYPSARNRNLGFLHRKPKSAEKRMALKAVRNLTGSPRCSFKRVDRNFLYTQKHFARSLLQAALGNLPHVKVGGLQNTVQKPDYAERSMVEKICNHHLSLDVNDTVGNAVLDTTVYINSSDKFIPLFDLRLTRSLNDQGKCVEVSAWVRLMLADGTYICTPYHFSLFKPNNRFESSITFIFQSLMSRLPKLRTKFGFYPSAKFDYNRRVASAVCKFYSNVKLDTSITFAHIFSALDAELKRSRDELKQTVSSSAACPSPTVTKTTESSSGGSSNCVVQVVYDQDGYVVKKKSLLGVTTHYLVRAPSGKSYEISNGAGSMKLLFNYTLHNKKFFIDSDSLTCDGRRRASYSDGFCWLQCFAQQNKFIPYALKVRPYVALNLLFKCGLDKSILYNLHFISKGLCHYDPNKQSVTKKFFSSNYVGGFSRSQRQAVPTVVSRPIYANRAIARGFSETVARRITSGSTSATIRFDPVTTKGTIYVYINELSHSVKILRGSFRLHSHPVTRESTLKCEYTFGGSGDSKGPRQFVSHIYSERTMADKLLAHFFSSLFAADKFACDCFNMRSLRRAIRSFDDVATICRQIHIKTLEKFCRNSSCEIVPQRKPSTHVPKVVGKRGMVVHKPKHVPTISDLRGNVTIDYTRLSKEVAFNDIHSDSGVRIFEVMKAGKTVLRVPNEKDSFRKIFNSLVEENISFVPKNSRNSDGVSMQKHPNAYCWVNVFYDNRKKIPNFIKVRPFVPIYLISRALGNQNFTRYVRAVGDGYCHYSSNYFNLKSNIHPGMYLGGQEQTDCGSGYADEIDSKVDMLVDKLLNKFTPKSDNLAFTAITNEVTRKFEAWTHRPFDVDINTCLSSKERKILGEMYPEYKLNFVGKSFSSHALFTAIRTLENHHLFRICGHENFVDFGGNIATHIMSNVSNTHLCLPNVDIKDSVRKINSKIFLNTFCRDTRGISVCSNKAQHCAVQKRRGVMVEVYDMSLEDICRAIISHDCDRVDMTLLLPGELLGDFAEINVYDNACVIVREGDTVKYRYGQSGETYTHSLRNLRDIMTRVVCSVDGVLFKRTLENNRGPLVHFSICPVNSIENGIMNFESVYSAHESNLVKIIVPKFDDRGFFKDVEVILDKSLVLHMVEFSANCIESFNRKSFEQLMSQFRSRKGYIIYNNKVIQENIELDQSELEGFLGVIWGCGMRIAEKTKYAARYVYNSYYAPSLVELFLNFVKKIYQNFTKCCYTRLLRVLRYIFGADSFPDHLSSQGRIVALEKQYAVSQKVTICNNVTSEDFFPVFYEKYVETSSNLLQGVYKKLDASNSPPPGFEHVLNSGGGSRPSKIFCSIYDYLRSVMKGPDVIAKLTVRFATVYDGIKTGVINLKMLKNFSSIRHIFDNVNFYDTVSYGWKNFKALMSAILGFLSNPCHYIYTGLKRLCKYVMTYLVGPGGKILDTEKFETFLSCYSSDDEDELDDLYEDLVKSGVTPQVAAEVYMGENPDFYRQYLLDGGLKKTYIDRVVASGGGGKESVLEIITSVPRSFIHTLLSLAKTTTYKLIDLLKFVFLKCKVLLESGYKLIKTKFGTFFFHSTSETIEVQYEGGWKLKMCNIARGVNPINVVNEVKRKVKIFYLKSKLDDVVAQRKSNLLIRLMDTVIDSGGGSGPDVFWWLCNQYFRGGVVYAGLKTSIKNFFVGIYRLISTPISFLPKICSSLWGMLTVIGDGVDFTFKLISSVPEILCNAIKAIYYEIVSGDPNTIISGLTTVMTLVTFDLIDLLRFRDLRSVLKVLCTLFSPIVSTIMLKIYPVVDNILILPTFVYSRTIGYNGCVLNYLRKLGLACAIKGFSLGKLLDFDITRDLAIKHHACMLTSDLHNLMRSPYVKIVVSVSIVVGYTCFGGGFCESILIACSVYRYFSALRQVINVANISIASDVDISELKLPSDIIRTCEDVLKKKFLNSNITCDKKLGGGVRIEEIEGASASGETGNRNTPSEAENVLFFRDPNGVNNLRGYEEPQYRDPEKVELIGDMRNEMCAMLRDYPFSTLISFVSTAHAIENAYNEYVFIEKSNISINLGKLEDVVKHYHVGYNTPNKLRPLFDDANLFMYSKGVGWQCLSTKAGGKISDPKFIFTTSKSIVEKLDPVDEVAFTTREFEVGYTNKKLLRLEENAFPAEQVTNKIDEMVRNKAFTIINKPPGSGKTTAISRLIVQLFDSADNFLVLSVTKAGRQELIDKVKTLRPNFPFSRIKTIESALMNGIPADIGHLIIDECFMAHCGQILSVMGMNKVSKATFYGDVNQIPYICRIPYVVSRYASTLFERVIWEFDSSSYRCPADVCYLLSQQTDVRGNKIYPAGVKAERNPLMRTMSVVNINGVEEIDPTEDDDTVFLTFTQAEKYDVSKALGVKNVHTVNEVQGRTVKNVKLVRLRGYANDIYNNQHQFVTAISRHTETFNYYIPSNVTSDKVKSEVGALSSVADFVIATFGFRQCV